MDGSRFPEWILRGRRYVDRWCDGETSPTTAGSVGNLVNEPGMAFVGAPEGMRRVSPGGMISRMGRGRSEERIMASSGLVRLGGVAGVLAGFAYATIVIVDRRGPLDPDVFTSSLDYLIQYVFLFALAATMVAAAGLHVLQRRSAGWLGV